LARPLPGENEAVGERSEGHMATTDPEPSVPAGSQDPAFRERLKDPVFSRAFDRYRDEVIQRALWAVSRRRSRTARGKSALAG
jgi:hypothetical protein